MKRPKTELKWIKHSILLIAASLSVLSAQSQAAIVAFLIGDKVATEKFNISMEIGSGLTAFSNVDGKNRPAIGMNFGMACNMALNENWYLNPAIYFFSQRSLVLSDAAIYTGDETEIMEATADARLNVQYIDIPILANYQFSDSPWRVGLGPQISFPTNSSILYELNDSEAYKVNSEDATENVEFGVIAALSYVVSYGRHGKGLTVGLRYYQGLTDTFDDSFYISNENNNLASYFALNLSFPFITDELAEKNVRPKEQ